MPKGPVALPAIEGDDAKGAIAVILFAEVERSVRRELGGVYSRFKNDMKKRELDDGQEIAIRRYYLEMMKVASVSVIDTILGRLEKGSLRLDDEDLDTE